MPEHALPLRFWPPQHPWTPWTQLFTFLHIIQPSPQLHVKASQRPPCSLSPLPGDKRHQGRSRTKRQKRQERPSYLHPLSTASWPQIKVTENQAGDHGMTLGHPWKTSNLLCESQDFLLLHLYLAENRNGACSNSHHTGDTLRCMIFRC